jgi:prepilin-type N-terminal cleavage/methylation domain-containing protein
MTSATSAPSVNERSAQNAHLSPACTCGATLADDHTRRGRSRRGFTLVELLVVIGIIVLLIGILLPMIARAMRQGNRARIASDLNAISAALDAYKADFGDYPRLIYTSATTYNGTGAGAALLGKSLMALGDSTSAAYNSSNTYTVGQIVLGSGSGTTELDYQATQAVPANNAPQLPTAAGPNYWQPIALGTAADGADGPGFRIRGTQGRVYGPYLQADKFKTLGLAIVDNFGNPVLYYAANPGHPTITADGAAANYGNNSSNGGVSNSYVGTAPGVTPGASPATPGSPCQSLYNYSDNDTVSLNAGAGTTAFVTSFPDISVMQAMLGDYSHVGYIAPGETAATTASFLLWSAGPDGTYGPVGANNVSSFLSLTPTAIKNLVIKSDDVTNFSFAQ